MKKIILLIAVVASMVNCHLSQAQTIDIQGFENQLQKMSSTKNEEVLRGSIKTTSSRYLLSPGDTFSVQVYGEPDLAQTEILVRPDGFATIQPVGEVKVAGESIETLTNILNGKFKKYMLSPQISVRIDTQRPSEVYVYGAVQKPGLYRADEVPTPGETTTTRTLASSNFTVAGIISRSGGIKHTADLTKVRITNNSTGKDEVVNLLKMIKEGDMTQDSYLRTGDTVFVPYLETDAQMSDEDFELVASSSISPATFPVRVIGAVTRPGVVDVAANSSGINTAIAASGGFLNSADQKVLAIKRKTPKGNISTINVNPEKMDMALRPNDLVVVRDKYGMNTGRLGFFSTVASSLGSFAGMYNGWAEMFNPTRRYVKD